MSDKTEYQLAMIMKYNRDGSPDKQTARFASLKKMMKHLQQERGYSQRYDLHKFGRKEVNRLVHDWKERGLSHRTIENKMADVRWLASKIGRREQVPNNNRALGLQQRALPVESKAIALDRDKLGLLPEREQLMTELRASFGFRTEEACKFQHDYAMNQRAGCITLKGSWCKGGRERYIQIANEQQRELLERVGRFQREHGDKSMIPKHRRFKSFYRDYNEARTDVGIPGHELRHEWAQRRFKDLAGIEAPHAGGPDYADLTPKQQTQWDKAAATVNSELGHGQGRQDITATYIGQRG